MWGLLRQRESQPDAWGASRGEGPGKQGACSEVCLFKLSALATELIRHNLVYGSVKKVLLSSSGALESQGGDARCGGRA